MNKAKLHFRDAIGRLTTAIAASAAVLACAVAAPAFADPHGRHGGGGGETRAAAPEWRRGGDMAGPPRGAPAPSWEHGGSEAGPLGPPVGGRPLHGPNWDGRKYNGYWVGGHWYYGAPEGPAFETPGFRPGFTPWRRGSVLPPAYQNYVVGDFGRFHLRRPPYGYHWVQVGSEFLLVSMSTGLIFDVVTGG